MCLSCSICISKICEHQNTISLPCGHLFHKKCAMDWYRSGLHNNCAYCRQSFDIRDVREHTLTFVECSKTRNLQEKINKLKMEKRSKTSQTQQNQLNEQLTQDNFRIRTALNDSQDLNFGLLVLASEMLDFTVDELKSLQGYTDSHAEVYKSFLTQITQYIDTYNQIQ
ncbi:E3 ubiquitin-protein ligase TRAIP [Chironomus tepperi]|uniref:E3 ubiquitin-protein ligase TRAIP n=1 Tax=Chironomus tepperi TaxID=113505 RepID=UPI00391F7A71